MLAFHFRTSNNLPILKLKISTMRIKEIRVAKLFGHFNYRIPLKNESIAILHGPNGCGKTTILRLLKAVTEINLLTLRRTQFDSLKILFYENVELYIKRTLDEVQSDDKGENKKPKYRITFICSEPGSAAKEYTPNRTVSLEMRRYLGYIEQRVPALIRVGPEEWLNRETGEKLTLEDLIDMYGEILPTTLGRILKDKAPEWLQKISSALSSHLILTQRLLRIRKMDPRVQSEGRERMSDVVEIYSNDVKEEISRILTESVAVAQSCDRTFPSRLLQELTHTPMSEAELRRKFDEIEEKRKRLISAGMLNDEVAMSLLARKLETTEIKVLELYLKDVEQKLEVFDRLQQRIQTFMEIINFKLNPKGKSINISRDSGFIFESKYGEQLRLAPRDLSSGEQHQIVLFYELLFKTMDGALILIDEPEISLHIGWQRVFLSDLEKVVKLTEQNIVMATHSPQIINNRWDLAVALDGGVEDEA